MSVPCIWLRFGRGCGSLRGRRSRPATTGLPQAASRPRRCCDETKPEVRREDITYDYEMYCLDFSCLGLDVERVLCEHNRGGVSARVASGVERGSSSGRTLEHPGERGACANSDVRVSECDRLLAMSPHALLYLLATINGLIKPAPMPAVRKTTNSRTK